MPDDREKPPGVAGFYNGTVGPGALLGEVGLVLNEDRNATVRATTDMWVLVADRGQFSQLMDDVPGVARAVLESLHEHR
jgi:CRP-like cAMP-binding protein